VILRTVKIYRSCGFDLEAQYYNSEYGKGIFAYIETTESGSTALIEFETNTFCGCAPPIYSRRFDSINQNQQACLYFYGVNDNGNVNVRNINMIVGVTIGSCMVGFFDSYLNFSFESSLFHNLTNKNPDDDGVLHAIEQIIYI
jgi:hypothetical protein